MRYLFQSESLSLEYAESHIDSLVLWESHCHAQYEMIAVLEGDVSIMLEGRSLRLTKNQIVIIPPLFYHTVTANKSGDYRRVTALFDIGAVAEVLHKEFMKKNEAPSIFSSQSIERLAEICIDDNKDFYLPLAESLMTELFYSSVQSERTDFGIEEDEFLKKAISYIDSHLCEKILLDDISLYTARSKSSVCHLFKEKMNISVKQYILQKKLALALKLIRSGTPPTLAAEQVGYENYGNFYRLYKEKFKTNPKTDKGKR